MNGVHIQGICIVYLFHKWILTLTEVNMSSIYTQWPTKTGWHKNIVF